MSDERRDPTVTSMILDAINGLRTETRTSLIELRGEFKTGISEVNQRLDGLVESRVEDAKESGSFKTTLNDHHSRILRLEGGALRSLVGFVSGLCALIVIMLQILFVK